MRNNALHREGYQSVGELGADHAHPRACLKQSKHFMGSHLPAADH